MIDPSGFLLVALAVKRVWVEPPERMGIITP